MIEPALNMGTVRDIFKRSGKIPVSKDRLIICAKGMETCSATFFRTLVFKPSMSKLILPLASIFRVYPANLRSFLI